MAAAQPRCNAQPHLRGGEYRSFRGNSDVSCHDQFRARAEAVAIDSCYYRPGKALDGLEHSLGVSLFDRHGAQIKPTVYGEALLRRAERILEQSDELERDIQLLEGLKAGGLAVGMGAFAAELSGSTRWFSTAVRATRCSSWAR